MEDLVRTVKEGDVRLDQSRAASAARLLHERKCLGDELRDIDAAVLRELECVISRVLALKLSDDRELREQLPASEWGGQSAGYDYFV